MEEITDINIEEYKKDYVAKSGSPLIDGEMIASRDAIIDALKTVSDPEIMINIWDMGLVYKVEQKDNGDVYIEMTFLCLIPLLLFCLIFVSVSFMAWSAL